MNELWVFNKKMPTTCNVPFQMTGSLTLSLLMSCLYIYIYGRDFLLGILLLELCILLIYAWQSEIATHHVTGHNTPIHNILSTAPQFSISQKALETLPDDGNVTPKHLGATIHN
jgi:hypothetical protein